MKLDPDLQSASERLLRSHEGEKLHVYPDTADPPHPTVGDGINLDSPGAAERLAAVGADYDAIRAGTADLTAEQAEQLLLDGISTAADAVQADTLGAWETLPASVKLGLIDMAYELGRTGLAGFHDMIRALCRGEWAAAAEAARDSKWDVQVPVRAAEDVALIRRDPAVTAADIPGASMA